MAAVNIPMKSIRLPQATIDSAIRLMGFDYGEHLFHVLAFDFGDDGGAVGIWREGSEFCARISLDALAEFWHSAQRGIDITEPGRALHGAALEIIEALMNEDLPKESPEGLAFNKLVTAVETYEKATLPPPFGNAGALPSPLPPGESAGEVPSNKKASESSSASPVEAVEVLTKDEIAEVLSLLKDHDGSDFEPECPACTAYQKLAANGWLVAQPPQSGQEDERDGEKELRARFEQYKQRVDVRLWIKGASRHAFRVWGDGYRAALAAISATTKKEN